MTQPKSKKEEFLDLIRPGGNSEDLWKFVIDNFVSKEEVKEIAQEFYNKGFGVCHYNDALERGEYGGKPLYYDGVLQQLLTKHKLTA